MIKFLICLSIFCLLSSCATKNQILKHRNQSRQVFIEKELPKIIKEIKKKFDPSELDKLERDIHRKIKKCQSKEELHNEVEKKFKEYKDFDSR